jgi:DNA-binding response OmpR family regulator
MRALIAEDDPHSAMQLSASLQREGCQLTVVHNGRDARQALLDGKPFDLVLLNWMLPHLDGWRIARQLSRSSSSPVVTVLMIGRNCLGPLRELCPGLADEFLGKPLVEEELQAVLEEARGKVLLRRGSSSAQKSAQAS